MNSRLLKTLLDRLVLGTGVLTGVLALAIFGVRRPPFGESLSYWLSFLAIAEWGLVLLAGSFAALWSRKIAALLLLLCVPVVGIPLLVIRVGYPDSALEYWLMLLLTLAPPLAISAFWWISDKFGRPRVRLVQTPSRARRIAAIAFTTLLVCTLLSLSVLFFASLRPGFSIDCKKAPPFAKPTRPEQVVFTAKILFACCKTTARVFPRFGGFAVATVTKRFWGLPWWNPGVVFLTQDIANLREPLFIDGDRQSGILGSLFPIVTMSICDRSSLLRNAQIDLRLVHDGPPKDGVRIIGKTERYVWSSVPHSEKLPGTTVIITGPAGTFTATSDSEGIYDVSGLPPGSYTIQSKAYKPEAGDYSACGPQKLALGSIGGCTLALK